MEDKLQYYRQPLVTATGIFLGFTLNFASIWVSNAFKKDRITEIIIGTGIILCVSLLLLVLYRVLNMNYPKDDVESYYKKTLIFFISAIGITFFSIIIVMIESYVINRR